jgi:hypothetical protein
VAFLTCRKSSELHQLHAHTQTNIFVS